MPQLINISRFAPWRKNACPIQLLRNSLLRDRRATVLKTCYCHRKASMSTYYCEFGFVKSRVRTFRNSRCPREIRITMLVGPRLAVHKAPSRGQMCSVLPKIAFSFIFLSVSVIAYATERQAVRTRFSVSPLAIKSSTKATGGSGL